VIDTSTKNEKEKSDISTDVTSLKWLQQENIVNRIHFNLILARSVGPFVVILDMRNKSLNGTHYYKSIRAKTDNIILIIRRDYGM
jgi:DNA-binding response OmpR family regulator